MIIYPTKQTIERFQIPMTKDLKDDELRQAAEHVISTESSDRLLCWGAKIFYIDGRKCIQLMNFASKFTVCLFDIKVSQLEDLGDMLAVYLIKLYTESPLEDSFARKGWLDKKKLEKISMPKLLEKLYKDHPFVTFSNLTDRTTISSMNNIQLTLLNKEFIYQFIKNGILSSLDIARRINWEYPMGMKEEKSGYVRTSEKFEELIRERYE